MARVIRAQIARVGRFDKRRLGGVEKIERTRARLSRELPKQTGQNSGRQMLYDLDADPRVERPFEIGDGADMVVRAATALLWRRREALDAMHSFGQARNQFSQGVQQESRAAADVQGPSDRDARHSQRFGHSYNTCAVGPLARCGNLMLPLGVAVVLDRTRLD